MRNIIKEQDQSLKVEVKKILEKTLESEKEKNKVVEELRKLREDIAKHQDQKYELDWENLSRTAHWTNNSINLS